MEWISGLAAALCFALACNLDTVLLAAGYGARGVKVTLTQSLVLAGVTTAVTACSLLLGVGAAQALPGRGAQVLGGLALVGIGCWFLLDWLRGVVQGGTLPPPPGISGWVALAAALAVNNAAAGVAAGAAGVGVAAAAGSNFLVTLLALPLGRRLGNSAGGGWALPVSGVLLVVLGSFTVLG